MTTDTFNSGSGNWISPIAGSVTIEGWGGGGGGASSEAGGGNRAGSGGGGGAYFQKVITLTLGQSIAYSVGAGGVGGTYDNDDATAGGTTTVAGGTYSAVGGGKGGFGGGAAGGAGGTASGGDTNTTGTAGSVNPTSTTGGNGGAGANGGAGGSGAAGSGSPATAGTAPGGGGGGGGDASGTNNGANGGAGRVSFTYSDSGTVAEGVRILRPVSAFTNAWDTYDAADIDDVVEQPGTGTDSAVVQASGGTSFEQSWTMQSPFVPQNIIAATIWFYAWTPHVQEIKRIRVHLGGTWYDSGTITIPLTGSYAWYSYTFYGFSIPAAGIDPRVGLTALTGGGNVLQIDAMYLHITNDEGNGGGGTVSGASAITGVGKMTRKGSGPVSGAGALAGVGRTSRRGAGLVSGVGLVIGAGLTTPPPSGYGSVSGTGSLTGVGRRALELTASQILAESLGTDESNPISSLTVRHAIVEVLGDDMAGGPIMLEALGFFVECLGIGTGERRDHEELFLFPWDMLR